MFESMKRCRRSLARVALCFAALAGAGSAQAVIYTGSWDPFYVTHPFEQLGWSASAVLNVPEACLAQPDGTYGVGSGACRGFSFLSASLSFYDIQAPSTVLETFAIGDLANVNINGVSVDNGKLSGIATGFFDEVVPTATGPAASIDGGGRYAFSLILLGGDRAQLYDANPITASPACADNAVPGTSCGKSLNVAHADFRVANVPEPQTVSMMSAGLAAFGLAAWARRRSGARRRG